jgi:hypothetical protein
LLSSQPSRPAVPLGGGGADGGTSAGGAGAAPVVARDIDALL